MHLHGAVFRWVAKRISPAVVVINSCLPSSAASTHLPLSPLAPVGIGIYTSRFSAPLAPGGARGAMQTESSLASQQHRHYRCDAHDRDTDRYYQREFHLADAADDGIQHEADHSSYGCD